MAISKSELDDIKKALKDHGFADDKIKEIISDLGLNAIRRSGSYNRSVEREHDRLSRRQGNIITNSLKILGLDDVVDAWQDMKEVEEDIRDLEKEKSNNLNDILEKLEKGQKLNDEETDVLKKHNELLRLKEKQRELGIRNIKSGLKDIYRVGKDLLDTWGKIDQAASKFSKSIGVGAKGMDAMRKSSIQTVAQGKLGANFNMSAEELIELQGNYMNQTGRRATMSYENQVDAAALNAIMKEGGGEFAASLEKFGLSYSESASRAAKMFKDANKYGISFQKYAENVQKGLQIAQNYTFKNGINGMIEMAKRATAIKLDMQQVANFADKVSSVEGSVEVGSRLQVLGGPFATFSDPLGMLHDSLYNMDDLMKRFESMTGNFAYYDKSKGTIDVNVFNRQRLKEAADAMGMNYSDVMESVLAQGRRKFVGERIAGMGYDEQQADLLKNAATIENGRALVSYVDQKGVTQTVDLEKRRLTPEEIDMIRAGTNKDSDNIRDIAIQLRGVKDILEGGQKQYENLKAQAVETTGIGNSIKKIASTIASSNTALWLILGALTLGKAGGGILKTIIGGGGLIKSWFGGKGVAAAGRAVGSTSGGARGFVNSVRSLGTERSTLGEVAGSFKYDGFRQGMVKTVGNLTKPGTLTGIGAGVGVGIYGGKMFKDLKEKRESGEIQRGSKEDRRKNIGAKAIQFGGYGASIGSAIGSFFPQFGGQIWGPMIGSAVGALTGTVVGAFQNKNNKDALLKKNALKSRGFDLQGDYKKKEIDEIMRMINNGGDGTITKAEFDSMSEKTKQKLIESGDAKFFPELEQVTATAQNAEFNAENVRMEAANITIEGGTKVKKMAEGGLLVGPSHSGGGMPILGSDVEVEGGEFVVNKRATSSNLPLLKAINGNGMNGLTVMPPASQGVSGPSSMSIEPINININGTIKLEGTNGRSVDITDDLLKSDAFIRTITRKIEEQISINAKGGLVVNRGFYN